MKLHSGIMSNKELAAWFGITEGSFRVKKKQKLDELKLYATFEEQKGKVNILEVLDDAPYNKNKSKGRNLIERVFDDEWDQSGLDTCAHVSDKIAVKYNNELQLAPSTTYGYVRDTRDKLYGKPFVGNGLRGMCEYMWCKRQVTEEGIEVYIPFSDEEQGIKRDLMRKYFATDEEKDILIKEMVEKGEIGKAEAYDLSCEYRGLNQAGFMAFKKELEERLGCSIVKGTMLRKSAWDEVKEIGEGN